MKVNSMQLLLIICFLIPLVCIGYFLSCLDKFIAEKGFLLETEKPSPVAIVLGDTELAKQVNVILEKDRIQVLKLTEPFMVEKYQNIQYLFALSENDVDNMVLIKIGSKVYGIMI